MDRFEQFKSRLGLANTARHQTERRSTQHAAREASQNRHLSSKEAETLARRTYEMVEELKPELRSRGITQTALCRHAFSDVQTSSRELHRVTLPPGKDPQTRDVRKHLEPYRRIATALEQLTQRRSGQLVHRLVEGTTCDDLRNASEHWLDLDRLITALERRIDALDQEFAWTAAYGRTLELRKKGAEYGRRLCWPLTDLEPPTGDEDPATLEAYARELEDDANGTSAFYRPRPQYYGNGNRHTAAQYLDMGAIQDVEFFYVPHAPVGHLGLWDLPQRRSNPASYEQAVARECEMMRESPRRLLLPSDRWDEPAQRPTGQLDPRNHPTLQYHVWLIVYPLASVASDDTLRIGPALYQAGEEGGAWIMPLSSENLAAIADAVWIDETRCTPLVDRLTELLLLDEAEEGSLTANLRRTGPWLQDNPVFKAERQRSQRQQQLLRIAGRNPRP